MHIILASLVTLIYVLSCLGAGYGLYAALTCGRVYANARPQLATRLVLRFLLGVWLINNLLVLVGLAGLLNRGVIIGLMLAGLGSLASFGRTDISAIPAAIRTLLQSWRQESSVLQGLLALFALIILAFAVAALVFPPVGDAEAFYVAYSKIIAAAGRLAPMQGAYEAFSNIGLPAELHFAALITLAGVPAAKLFVWFVSISVGVLLLGIAEQVGAGRSGKLFALIILFLSSTFTYYIIDGKVDLFAAAYGMAAFHIVLSGVDPLRAALLGLFAGAATVAKFSYLPSCCPALAALVIWQCHQGRWQVTAAGMQRLVRVSVWASGGFLLSWFPHLIKNGVLFDAPLAPFIGGTGINYLSQTWFEPEVTRRIVLSYPLALVFGRYPMQGGGLSLLMIAFLPLVMLRWRAIMKPNSPLLAITLAGLIGTVAWVALRPSVIAPRYILAPLLLLVPIIAIATESAWTEFRSRILRIGMVSTILFATILPLYQLKGLVPAMLNLAGPNAPCVLASDYCAPLQELNRVAVPGGRVYFVSFYGFWLREDLLQCVNDPREDVRLMRAHDVLAELSSIGFHYVALDHSSQSHQVIAEKLAAASTTKDIRLIATSSTISIYALPQPASAATRCNEVAPGEWKIQAIYKNK